MAKNKRAFRARGSKVQPGGQAVKGTEVLPHFEKRTVLKKGILGIPRKVEERVVTRGRHSGIPYVNPDREDRRLNGKARRRARRRGEVS